MIKCEGCLAEAPKGRRRTSSPAPKASGVGLIPFELPLGAALSQPAFHSSLRVFCELYRHSIWPNVRTARRTIPESR
jgi:hypothetical protein